MRGQREGELIDRSGGGRRVGVVRNRFGGLKTEEEEKARRRTKGQLGAKKAGERESEE